MRRFAPGLSAVVLIVASACSSTPPPLPGGPPPEYETPRPYPLASSSSSASAAPAPPPAPFGTVDELGAKIDAYMAGYGSKTGEAFAPSGVLVVAVKGLPVLVRNYGKADRKAGTAPSLSTRFRIGSLTKQFTAAAVLKLADEGKLKLDDTAQKLVPELPDSYKPVTIQMLLQQTSGLVSYTEDAKLMAKKTENVPQSEMIAWLAGHAPHFAPGSKWEYSNSNYYLLAVIAERAAKEPFEAILTKSVLAPAGMKDTSSVASGPGSAIGYTRDAKNTLVPAALVSSSLPFGAGFLVSSANDMLAWDRALAKSAVLSDADKTKMWTPGLGDYAMGWIIAKRADGSEVTWHNGAIDGFGSFFARAPKEDLAVVFLSNVFDFDASQAGSDVLKMALGGPAVPPPVERPTIAIDDAYAKSVTGEYVLTKDSKSSLEKTLGNPGLVEAIEGFTIAFEGGALTGHPVGQGTFPLSRSPDSALFNTGLRLEIVPDFGAKKPAKTASGFTLKQGGLSVVYERGKLKARPKKAGDAGSSPEKKAPEKKAPETKAPEKKPNPAK